MSKHDDTDDAWFDNALEKVTRGPKTLVVVVALGYGFGATMLDDLKPLLAFLLVLVTALLASAFYEAGQPAESRTQGPDGSPKPGRPEQGEQ